MDTDSVVNWISGLDFSSRSMLVFSAVIGQFA